MSNTNKNSYDIYDKIKDKIIHLEYKPGDHLKESKLAKEFGTSRTPIREAFARLESEGLVELIPNRGAFIIKTSFNKLLDLYEVRAHLLELVAKLAVERLSDNDIENIKKLVTKIENETDNSKISQLDLEFHLIINSAIANEELTNILENLRIKYFSLWHYQLDETYYQELKDEYEKIVKALEDRDEEKCIELFRLHAKRIMLNLMNQFDSKLNH